MLVLRYASCVYAHSIPDLYQPIQRFAGEIGNPAAGDMGQNKGVKQDVGLVFQGFHAVKGLIKVLSPA